MCEKGRLCVQKASFLRRAALSFRIWIAMRSRRADSLNWGGERILTRQYTITKKYKLVL